MQYVSELLGAPVRDPDGHVVARVSDVLVPADADYPAVDAIALKPPKGETRTVPWSALHVQENGGFSLFTALAPTITRRPLPAKPRSVWCGDR